MNPWRWIGALALATALAACGQGGGESDADVDADAGPLADAADDVGTPDAALDGGTDADGGGPDDGDNADADAAPTPDTDAGDPNDADSADGTPLPDADPDADADAAPDADAALPDADTTDASDSELPDDTDSDLDGLPDAEELAQGTDPLNADTDGDHVDDRFDAAPLDASRRQAVLQAEPGTLVLRVIHAAPLSGGGAPTVHVAGDFNGWTHTPMAAQADGTWTYALPLPTTGTALRYKFTLGDWSGEEGQFRGPGNDRRYTTPAGPAVVNHAIPYWAGQAESSLVGRLDVDTSFEIPELGRTGTVRVWLPTGYEGSTQRYPVLYMQDGQNLFDRTTAAFGTEWGVDETVLFGMFLGTLPPTIVVGVDNGSERACDYTPFFNATGCEGRDGRGEAYAAFMAETLKPWVDANYRTLSDRQHSAIAGSSRGGFAAHYIALMHPEAFGRAAGLSATLLEAILGGSMGDLARSEAGEPAVRWYADYGDAEVVFGYNAATLIGGMDAFLTGLRDAGVPESQIRRVIVPGAVHNEADWARRVGDVLVWLWGW